jgi:hypothetical protein
LADRARELCQETHAERIERAALAYHEMDDQASSALDEIENILIEAGIAAMPKRLSPP